MSSIRQYNPGDVIIQQGDEGDTAYIIEKGNVEIVIENEQGTVQIGTRGPQSLIGEMAMVDAQPRVATVRALDDCELLEIDRNDFERRLSGSDPLVRHFMQVILTRYRDTLSRIEHTGANKPTKTDVRPEDIEKSDSLHEEATQAIRDSHELVHAISEDQIVLFYQPIISVKDGSIAGFEGLARWIHPEKGLISPGHFIPLAEESGLIREMTYKNLYEACSLLPEINELFGDGQRPFMSVNFSSQMFAEPDLVNIISDILKKHKSDPSQFKLEITETLLMEHPEEGRKALAQCREKGMQVAVDDFGVGYSSLGYLNSYPIDTLKIDRSFVSSMMEHDLSLGLVKAIVGLSKTFGLKTVAEGVEQEQEVKILHGLGVDYIQGFLYAKPMPLAELKKFIGAWAPPKHDE